MDIDVETQEYIRDLPKPLQDAIRETRKSLGASSSSPAAKSLLKSDDSPISFNLYLDFASRGLLNVGSSPEIADPSHDTSDDFVFQLPWRRPHPLVDAKLPKVEVPPPVLCLKPLDMLDFHFVFPDEELEEQSEDRVDDVWYAEDIRGGERWKRAARALYLQSRPQGKKDEARFVAKTVGRAISAEEWLKAWQALPSQHRPNFAQLSELGEGHRDGEYQLFILFVLPELLATLDVEEGTAEASAREVATVIVSSSLRMRVSLERFRELVLGMNLPEMFPEKSFGISLEEALAAAFLRRPRDSNL